jgi:hypothetical protein
MRVLRRPRCRDADDAEAPTALWDTGCALRSGRTIARATRATPRPDAGVDTAHTMPGWARDDAPRSGANPDAGLCHRGIGHLTLARTRRCSRLPRRLRGGSTTEPEGSVTLAVNAASRPPDRLRRAADRAPMASRPLPPLPRRHPRMTTRASSTSRPCSADESVTTQTIAGMSRPLLPWASFPFEARHRASLRPTVSSETGPRCDQRQLRRATRPPWGI